MVWDANTSKWIVPGGPWLCGGAGKPVRSRPLILIFSLLPEKAVPCCRARHKAFKCCVLAATMHAHRPSSAAGVVEGELPPRSSHRMAAVPGGAVAFGGAVDRGARSAELHLLTGQGRLSWRACQLGNTGPMPAARGAHAMEIAGGRLYVVGGYGEVRHCCRLVLKACLTTAELATQTLGCAVSGCAVATGLPCNSLA